ncbi:hypothetical protein ADUPG1_011044, partial [Aduncisulcus paluster]
MIDLLVNVVSLDGVERVWTYGGDGGKMRNAVHLDHLSFLSHPGQLCNIHYNKMKNKMERSGGEATHNEEEDEKMDSTLVEQLMILKKNRKDGEENGQEQCISLLEGLSIFLAQCSSSEYASTVAEQVCIDEAKSVIAMLLEWRETLTHKEVKEEKEEEEEEEKVEKEEKVEEGMEPEREGKEREGTEKEEQEEDASFSPSISSSLVIPSLLLLHPIILSFPSDSDSVDEFFESFDTLCEVTFKVVTDMIENGTANVKACMNTLSIRHLLMGYLHQIKSIMDEKVPKIATSDSSGCLDVLVPLIFVMKENILNALSSIVKSLEFCLAIVTPEVEDIDSKDSSSSALFSTLSFTRRYLEQCMSISVRMRKMIKIGIGSLKGIIKSFIMKNVTSKTIEELVWNDDDNQPVCDDQIDGVDINRSCSINGSSFKLSHSSYLYAIWAVFHLVGPDNNVLRRLFDVFLSGMYCESRYKRKIVVSAIKLFFFTIKRLGSEDYYKTILMYFVKLLCALFVPPEEKDKMDISQQEATEKEEKDEKEEKEEKEVLESGNNTSVPPPPPPPPMSLLPPVPLTSLPSISCLLFSLALLIDMLDRASRETIGYSLQKCSIADGIVSIRSKKEMIIQLCWKERRQAERERKKQEEVERRKEEELERQEAQEALRQKKGFAESSYPVSPSSSLFSSVDNDPKLSVDDTVMP